MSGAVDIQGYSYTLGYNDRGDATSVSYPGLIASTLGYDADGYLASESLTNQGVAFPRYPNTTMRAFSVTSRNGRGQILQSADAAPLANERVLANYDGLGRVTHPQLHQTVVTVQNSLVSYASGDLYTYDGLGNRVTGTQADTVLGVGTFHNNGATSRPPRVV